MFLAPVALSVRGNLRSPPIGIRLCAYRSMSAVMSVPKASVYENHRSISTQNQIRRSGKRVVVKAVAVSGAVQCLSHDEFRCSILLAHSPHELASLGRWRRET
jgi:hypothetical protein